MRIPRIAARGLGSGPSTRERAGRSGFRAALGRLPMLRQMLRERRLVTPFKKSVVSSRGHFILRSKRVASERDVSDFEAWLLAEAKKGARLKA